MILPKIIANKLFDLKCTNYTRMITRCNQQLELIFTIEINNTRSERRQM
jgi:hypothetical protein